MIGNTSLEYRINWEIYTLYAGAGADGMLAKKDSFNTTFGSFTITM